MVLEKIRQFFDSRTVEQINNITVCEATGPAIWSDSVIEYLKDRYGVVLGNGPFDKEQLENRFSHIGETLIFPMRSLSIGSNGYRMDHTKHSTLDQYVLHNFAGSWVEKKRHAWERDSQGRSWQNRWYSNANADSNKGPGCYPVVTGGTVCQSGESPGEESAAALFDMSTETKWLQFMEWGTFSRSPNSNTVLNNTSVSFNLPNSPKSPRTPPATVTYRFPIPFPLENYTLVVANDFPERDPKDWDIWASEDNITYVLVDSRRNWTISPSQGLGDRRSELMFQFNEDIYTSIDSHTKRNFSYLRINVYNVSDSQKADAVQISLIRIENHPQLPPVPPQCTGYPFSWSKSRVCSGEGTYDAKESPSMALDGKLDTKWLSKWRTSAPSPPYLIVQRSAYIHPNLTLPPQNIGEPNHESRVLTFRYTLVTANDFPCRDPISWNLWAISGPSPVPQAPAVAAEGVPRMQDGRWILVDSRRNVSGSLPEIRGAAAEFDVPSGDVLLQSEWLMIEFLALREPAGPSKCDCPRDTEKCLQIADFFLRPVFFSEKNHDSPSSEPMRSNPKRSIPEKLDTEKSGQSDRDMDSVPVPGFREYQETFNIFGYPPTGVLASEGFLSQKDKRGTLGSGVPRIIHQSWKTLEIPETLRGYVASWLRQHPKWEYRFWSDTDCRELIRLANPGFLAVYDGYEQGVLRADASRYHMLKVFGGVYADLDFEALRPIEPILGNSTLVLGQEPYAHVHVVYNISRLVCNALMASKPDHPFWDIVLNELEVRAKTISSISATGPRALESAVVTYEELLEKDSGMPGLTILDPEVLYPTFDETNAEIKSTCKDLLPTEALPPSSLPFPISLLHASAAVSKNWNTEEGSRSSSNTKSLEIRNTEDLQARRLAECWRLKSLGYKNSPVDKNISYAVHHWVHTWYTSYFSRHGINAYTLADQIFSELEATFKAKSSNPTNSSTSDISSPPPPPPPPIILTAQKRLPSDFE